MGYVNSNLVRDFQPPAPQAFWSGEWSRRTVVDVPRQMDPEEREFARRLGKAIQAARLERDVSQERLAEWVGTSPGTLGRWERGANPPKSYQLAKMWDRLNAIRPLSAERLFSPPDDLSELDRLQIAEAVARGELAAWRPRRRATKQGGDAHAGPLARRPRKGPQGSTRG